MASIGSVFLGDSKRIRLLSGSTPPSSPPASATNSMSGVLSGVPSPTSPSEIPPPNPPAMVLDGTLHAEPSTKSVPLEPELALELRVRWLEALVFGVNAKKGAADVKQSDSLIKSAQDLQRRLDTIVEGNDGLKRFISHYDQHAQYLTPSFALSGLAPGASAYDNMSQADLETYLKEMESDIRSADRDMREIEALEAKGVTGAGKLADYVPLLPRVEALLQAYAEDAKRVDDLEKRIAGIVESHAVYIDALSELFVAWDDAITDAENEYSRSERERQERQRLGLE
ncbi:hypothetical protein PM082_010538 [Marasmius tenuissimus]|nr:hypothetical protein PM082_010538 [Marasmius tenuissimus]